MSKHNRQHRENKTSANPGSDVRVLVPDYSGRVSELKRITWVLPEGAVQSGILDGGRFVASLYDEIIAPLLEGIEDDDLDAALAMYETTWPQFVANVWPHLRAGKKPFVALDCGGGTCFYWTLEDGALASVSTFVQWDGPDDCPFTTWQPERLDITPPAAG